MDLVTLQAKLKGKVKNYYTHSIFPTAFKQRNAALAGGTEQTDMDTLVSDLKTDIDKIELDIDLLADTLIFDNFSEDTETNMIAHVGTYLNKNVTKEEQKLSVAVALQSIEKPVPVDEFAE